MSSIAGQHVQLRQLYGEPAQHCLSDRSCRRFLLWRPGQLPGPSPRSSPNQWDPNLGFTYDLFGDGKTVLRAGAEYIYDTPNNFTLQRNQQNPPFATSVSQSLNTYTPFSNPWSAPTIVGGPGATTAASILANPFPTGASFVGTPSPANAIFPSGGQCIVPVSKYHRGGLYAVDSQRSA